MLLVKIQNYGLTFVIDEQILQIHQHYLHIFLLKNTSLQEMTK